jgi:hypothetical protein
MRLSESRIGFDTQRRKRLQEAGRFGERAGLLDMEYLYHRNAGSGGAVDKRLLPLDIDRQLLVAE